MQEETDECVKETSTQKNTKATENKTKENMREKTSRKYTTDTQTRATEGTQGREQKTSW